MNRDREEFPKLGDVNRPAAGRTGPVVQGDDSSTRRADPVFTLVGEKSSNAILCNITAVFDQARSIPKPVAFVKAEDPRTGEFTASAAERNAFSCRAAFDRAGTAMPRFACIRRMTAAAGLLGQTVLIADRAVHAAGGDHIGADLLRHLHAKLSFFLYSVSVYHVFRRLSAFLAKNKGGIKLCSLII